MKYIFSIIEQLDLAAQQLALVRPSFARFALLLVDNTVELMLHSACKAEIDSTTSTFSSPPKYDAETTKRALGNYFDEKSKFCRGVGLITQDEFDFIATGHKYRNELYHVGIRHDELIYPLAWQYHELACDLFAKLRPRGWSWSPGADVSDSVKAHWPGAVQIFDFDRQFPATRDSLKRCKPGIMPAFADQIAAYAARRIIELDEWLDFLVRDNPNSEDEATILEDIQFVAHLGDSLGMRMVGIHSLSNFKKVEHWQQLFDKARANWTPKYKTRPTQRWLSRADALRSEENPSDVIRKYNGLTEEMAWFEEVVNEAAYELDTWIQLQVDAALGK